jgi:hypothetical protein
VQPAPTAVSRQAAQAAERLVAEFGSPGATITAMASAAHLPIACVASSSHEVRWYDWRMPRHPLLRCSVPGYAAAVRGMRVCYWPDACECEQPQRSPPRARAPGWLQGWVC